MDLPTSGWYPDPYGTPALLRWWDGAAWTQHTHQDQSAGTTATAVQATAVQATTGALSRTQPPTGPPTSPQPALPATIVQPAVQPARVQPARVQPGFDGGPDGTQVLFLGADPWQAPGRPGEGQAQFGYGYQQARRRRRWLMGGVAAGTGVAVAVIAVIVASLGSSPPASPASTPASTAANQAPAPASSAPQASPSASLSPSAGPPPVMLTDPQSGLSYQQLPAPWQATCPSGLNNGTFTWTFGESAVAGQISNGQTTWYGQACSGPLPQQYGYNSVADLKNTATTLANSFQGADYNALNHTATPGISQPVQVSGHAGWELTYAISYTDAQAQGATWTSEQAAVVVVDTGAGNAPAVFFTSIPSSLGESYVATLVSSLQLSALPQAGGSPADGSPPAPSGAPAGNGPPAGQGNGNGNENHP